MPITYRNRSAIVNKNPEVAEALDDFALYIENITNQTNSSHNHEISPPPDIQSIQVTASQGIFDVAIMDNTSPVVRGINYFLEYSTSPNFNSPVVIDLGASRNWRGYLGNQMLYWRAYSAYPTSGRSNPVYYQAPSLAGQVANPVAVSGGGTSTGPAPLPSSGSGTTPGATGGDGGFGNRPFRGDFRPRTTS